jgi:hypothetical protein
MGKHVLNSSIHAMLKLIPFSCYKNILKNIQEAINDCELQEKNKNIAGIFKRILKKINNRLDKIEEMDVIDIHESMKYFQMEEDKIIQGALRIMKEQAKIPKQTCGKRKSNMTNFSKMRQGKSHKRKKRVK